jgi:SAM-dependent methyltransferase
LNCPLCHAPGDVLYRDLRDRLFHAPGQWTLKHCRACVIAWLDPMPDDLARAYENYYTHHESPAPSGSQRVYRRLLRLTPLYRERERLNLMFLDNVPPGRLLEVGCGSGQRLAAFRARGWQTEGQEIDSRAPEGVHIGPLHELALPESSYDAVVMNHVIEHVPDPVALLGECRRLLKPGGAFVATTPNLDSHGHRRFGETWVALDPPRHLHLFTPGSLQAVAGRAGFAHAEVWTTGARAVSIALGSLALQRQGRYDMLARPGLADSLRAVLFQLRATDEECVLKATK